MLRSVILHRFILSLLKGCSNQVSFICFPAAGGVGDFHETSILMLQKVSFICLPAAGGVSDFHETLNIFMLK